MIPLIEITTRGGVSSFMRGKFVKSDENKNLFYIDARDSYGWAMS